MFWAPYLSFCRISNTLFIIFSCFLVIFPPALLFFPSPIFWPYSAASLIISFAQSAILCLPAAIFPTIFLALVRCALSIFMLSVSRVALLPSWLDLPACLVAPCHLLVSFTWFLRFSFVLCPFSCPHWFFSLLHLSRFALPIHRMVWKALERKSFVWIKKPMVSSLLSTTRTDTTVMESCTRLHYFFAISTAVCHITARSVGQHLHSK